MQPNTRAVFIESPGSLVLRDAGHAGDRGGGARSTARCVLMDNTWATPLYFRALDKGVDLSIQAGTKYIGGHSDVMLGTVSANAAAWPRLKDTVGTMGLCVGPDDMYLGLRGLRTLGGAARAASGVRRWRSRAGCERGRRSARAASRRSRADPGHAIWQRDFTGACGLFSIVLKPVPQAAVHAFIDALTLFGIGASWGGYESLDHPVRLRRHAHRHAVGAGRPDACACISASKTSTI